MSNNSSQDKTEKKKRDVWQEAGEEFYQESYPSGSGLQDGHRRKSARRNFPLPSHTARRNSYYAYSRRRNTTYGRSRTGTVNAYTYNSTGVRTTTATIANEVLVSGLPDLADMTIPNERKRWEELHKIKAMPVSMAAKKELKAQLTTIPMLKLKGWKRFRWHQQRLHESLKTIWVHRMRNKFIFWQRSLQDIDVRCGTSIVNVFLYIKWTFFLNLLIFTIVALFLILPMIIGGRDGKPSSPTNCPIDFDSNKITNTSSRWDSEAFTRRRQLSDCCTTSYYDESNTTLNRQHSFWRAFTSIFRSSKEIEYSPLVYGFYHVREFGTASIKYNFAFAYAFLPVAIFVFCMILMVRQIGAGIKELILAGEGEFHQYSNMIFSGWDHYTKDEAGAKFKKKILKHEMKIALKTEKLKVETIQRTRKQTWKLFLMRVIANLLVLGIQVMVGILIFHVSEFSIQEGIRCTDCNNVLNQSSASEEDLRRLGTHLLPATTITICNLVFPIILRHIGRLEKYSAEVQMTWDLIRTLFARLLAIAFAGFKFYSATYCSKLEDTCNFCKGSQEVQPKKSLCWESVLGVQLYMLVIVDFTIKVFMTFVVGGLRNMIGIYIPLRLCKKIGNMKFSILRNSLDIVYIQCLAWFFYFAPFIPLLTAVYCLLVFYLKKYTVLVNCREIPDTYRTMRTTTVFVITKLISFAVVSLVLGFVLNDLEPSKGCGPFRELSSPWDAVQELYSGPNSVPSQITNALVSPGVTIPLAIILFLLTYYYHSVAQANRNMVETLRHLLVLEGHDKQYLFARLNTLRKQSLSSLHTGRSGTAATNPDG